MPIDWGSGVAAGISSAAGLLGGFMNRGKSQRDLMWEQSRVSRDHRKWELLNTPGYEMEGLRRAGINPMLPFANGGSTPGPSGFTPGIAAPVNPGQYLAGGVAAGVSSAIDLFRSEAQVMKTFAEVDQIAANIKQISASTQLTEQQRINAIAEQRRIFADEVLKIGQAVLNSEQVRFLSTHRELLESQIAINKWTELSEQARSRLAQAGVPLAQADAAFYESWYGEFLRWVERTKDAINPFGGRGVGAPLAK